MENEAEANRIKELALSVWDGNSEAVRRFMEKPHPEMDSRTPKKLLESESGCAMVEGVLMKIIYGLPV